MVGMETTHSVSSLGRVRRECRPVLWRKQELKQRVLKQQVDKWGYHYVFLTAYGSTLTRNVHVLVAAAFIGPRVGALQTDHMDGNKGNNRADNLRYLTASENTKARMATGCGVGDRNPRSKLRAEWINPIRRLYREGVSMPKIGRAFGVGACAIHGVISGRCWSRVADE